MEGIPRWNGVPGLGIFAVAADVEKIAVVVCANVFVEIFAYRHVVENMHPVALLVIGRLRTGREKSPGDHSLEKYCRAEGSVVTWILQVLEEIIGLLPVIIINSSLSSMDQFRQILDWALWCAAFCWRRLYGKGRTCSSYVFEVKVADEGQIGI